MTITIIGTGNLATHLCKAFAQAEVKIAQVYGRTLAKANEVAILCQSEPISDLSDVRGDLVIIAVSDDAIDDVCKHLPTGVKEKSIVTHTSGTKPMTELVGFKKRGVFYPLNTFSKSIDLDMSSTPILLNGSPEIVEILRPIAEKISKNVSFLSDEDRKQAHLSAVVISNFTNHLIHLSKSRLEHLDIDPEVIEPLLQETIRKQTLTTAYDAQTGPARRKDFETIAKHLELLDDEEPLKSVYQVISDSIIKTY